MSEEQNADHERAVTGLMGWGQTEADARETVRLLTSDDPADVAELQDGIRSILDRLVQSDGPGGGA